MELKRETVQTDQPGPGSSADAFTREVIRNKLLAVAPEMGIVLARTSMSPIVYEVLDFACGITDTEARVIAQDNGLCLFTGTFQPQVASVLAVAATLQDASRRYLHDQLALWRRNAHTADVALVMPIFVGDTLIAFGISVTHWTEIGGKVLGSSPLTRPRSFRKDCSSRSSGSTVQGIINEAIIDIIRANVRLPRCRSAISARAWPRSGWPRHACEILERYGLARRLTRFGAILDHGEAIARTLCSEFLPGSTRPGHHRRRRHYR